MAFVWSWLSKSFSHQESEHLKEKLKEALEGKDNSQLSSILAGYGHCDESQSGTGELSFFSVPCRVLTSRVSFWHPGPRKIPILGGNDTLSFGHNLLKIL